MVFMEIIVVLYREAYELHENSPLQNAELLNVTDDGK
jgi:hypothetical protein